MDLRSIEIFLAVCEAGGVTAAAGPLGITQAAVSQRIAQLERDLGVQLFDRKARPQKLTPAGVLLRTKGARIAGDFRDMEHALSRYRDTELPELRVGIIESIAPALVRDLVPELRSFAGTLSVTSGLVGRLLPEVLEERLDIMVTTESLDDVPGLERHTLIREPFALLLPAGLEPPRDLAGLKELGRKLPFLGYGSGHRMSGIINQQFDRMHLDIPRTLNLISSAAVIDVVRSGFAWSIITPLCLYSAKAEVGELTVAPIPGMSFSRYIELAALEGRLGDIPRRVAASCVRILNEHAVPVLRQHVPFAVDEIVCGEHAGDFISAA
jgi:DNA-binding transcriptional LysR family regulator